MSHRENTQTAADKMPVRRTVFDSLQTIAERAAEHPFKLALLGGALIWVAMPPLGIWPLAWLAVIPFVLLIQAKTLPAKATRNIWLASWIFWAASLYFIPIPHWALWFGWIAMSLYLSIYLPFFVTISRRLVHDMNVPVIVAVPVVWTGLEWIRAHLITGFGMMMLGHSQYQLPMVIQISDIFGGYAVSFLLVLFAVLWSNVLFSSQRLGTRMASMATAIVCVAAALGYGYFRLNQAAELSETNSQTLRVGIVQGSIDTVFPKTEEEAVRLEEKKVNEYRTLASSDDLFDWQNGSGNPKCDLVVWPEGKFPCVELFVDNGQAIDDELKARIQERQYILRHIFHGMQSVTRFNDDPPGKRMNPQTIPAIVGTQSVNPHTDEYFNSALLIDNDGNVQSRYLKMHRVMFGEYVPFEKKFPVLANLTPSGIGLTPGTTPVVLPFKGFNFCPNICFESSVPHLIRKQVNSLEEKGQEPDLMINLSDDGWFYGTSSLDFHLACNVFRAVEMRKPTIVAANTGFSANIDGCGVLHAVGPRRRTAVIVTDIRKDGRYSIYRSIGDWPVFIFGFVCIAVFGLQVLARLRAVRARLSRRKRNKD